MIDYEYKRERLAGLIYELERYGYGVTPKLFPKKRGRIKNHVLEYCGEVAGEFTAEEALELGIADTVMTIDKKKKKQAAENRTKASVTNMLQNECLIRLKDIQLTADGLEFDK